MLPVFGTITQAAGTPWLENRSPGTAFPLLLLPATAMGDLPTPQSAAQLIRVSDLYSAVYTPEHFRAALRRRHEFSDRARRHHGQRVDCRADQCDAAIAALWYITKRAVVVLVPGSAPGLQTRISPWHGDYSKQQ